MSTLTLDSQLPIDLEHLAKYTLGSLELENELLDLFATQSSVYVAQMLDAPDPESWRNGAHTLKGSARAVGAFGVGDAAEALENLAYCTARSQRQEALRSLEAELCAAISFIRDRGRVAG